MSKLNNDVIKSIMKLNAGMIASYKLFFDGLKRKGIVAIADWNWNKPLGSDFKAFGADAKRYMKSLRNDVIAKNIGSDEISELIKWPDTFEYVTEDELKKFETVTYPKLYAKWLAERKQKRAANGDDANKIRAKIAKLQKQLKELED